MQESGSQRRCEIQSAGSIRGRKHKSLERLYEYTKFHIGVYISLTSAYVAFASAKVGEQPLTQVNLVFLLVAVLFFMLAGVAGGVIISSITQTEALTSREFLAERIGPWAERIGPWKSKLWMVAIKWTWVEHTSFWLGVSLAIASLVVPHFYGTSCVGGGD